MPTLPDALQASRESHILIRYDGVKTTSGPRIFFVVPAEDLAKVPDAVTMSAFSGRRDGLPVETDAAFFVKSSYGVNLYVDTEASNSVENRRNFFSMLDRASQQANIRLFNGMGDIDLMRNESGDMDPPNVMAYVANGFERISFQDGLEAISEARANLNQAKVAHIGIAELLEAADAIESDTDPIDPFSTEEPSNDLGAPGF